jgi:hypothetical protein
MTPAHPYSPASPLARCALWLKRMKKIHVVHTLDPLQFDALLQALGAADKLRESLRNLDAVKSDIDNSLEQGRK